MLRDSYVSLEAIVKDNIPIQVTLEKKHYDRARVQSFPSNSISRTPFQVALEDELEQSFFNYRFFVNYLMDNQYEVVQLNTIGQRRRFLFEMDKKKFSEFIKECRRSQKDEEIYTFENYHVDSYDITIQPLWETLIG